MLLGLLIGMFFRSLVNQFYNLLHGIMPDIFPIYNSVTKKDLYERLNENLDLTAFILTVFTTVFISQRFNNDRYEYIVSKTDGKYRINEVFGLYAKSFAISDVIASLLVGLVFTVPTYFIPKQFFANGSLISELLYIVKVPTNILGVYFGSLISVVLFTAAHFVFLAPTLGYYRAKWLSGFAEGQL